VGLRTTQYTLLSILSRSGEVRQVDLGMLMLLDGTTLTRNLRPLVKSGWVAVRSGDDRREKRIVITEGGIAKLLQARPIWSRAQKRMKSVLPEGLWQNLLTVLPDVAQSAVDA